MLFSHYNDAAREGCTAPRGLAIPWTLSKFSPVILERRASPAGSRCGVQMRTRVQESRTLRPAFVDHERNRQPKMGKIVWPGSARQVKARKDPPGR